MRAPLRGRACIRKQALSEEPLTCAHALAHHRTVEGDGAAAPPPPPPPPSSSQAAVTGASVYISGIMST